MNTPFQTIVLPNGKSAVVIIPELVDQLAVVDLKVIKRLASLLPTADFSEIQSDFIDKVNRTHNLTDFISVLKDEVSFHESVNLITAYNPTAVEENEVAVSQGMPQASVR